jgi:hypothetical protein
MGRCFLFDSVLAEGDAATLSSTGDLRGRIRGE